MTLSSCKLQTCKTLNYHSCLTNVTISYKKIGGDGPCHTTLQLPTDVGKIAQHYVATFHQVAS